MIRYILDWLRAWRASRVLHRRLSSIDVKLGGLRTSLREHRLLAEQQLEHVRVSQSEAERACEKAIMALEQALQDNKRLEEALDATREQLKTAEEIVIPGLVSANNTFKETWDAQSATMVMRNVAVNNRDQD